MIDEYPQKGWKDQYESHPYTFIFRSGYKLRATLTTKKLYEIVSKLEDGAAVALNSGRVIIMSGSIDMIQKETV